MIAAPPSDAGAVKLTLASPGKLGLTVATIPVGAVGTVTGVTALDSADGRLVPIAFVAVTVNVYAVPLTRPATAIGELVPVTVAPPGSPVTV